MARAHPASVVTLALCIAVAGGAVARAQTTGTLQGTVVDARDGTPLEKVSVRIQDTPLVTITTSDGRFLLENVPSGHRELYVSAVDFVLTRRGVEIPAGEVLEITIPIAAGTGTYTETVNVSSAAGADARAAGGGQVLRSNELQQLRGVITNDPMRAIHVLPGVATGDDLRSEFSVRGLPVRNMNFTFEGISTPLLVHTVQGVQDGGSIAMVNGDVLEEIALAPGAYAERHGNHTGAELNFLVREGSRDRLRGHVRPSMTDTSVVLEGPLGSTRRGSWLLSARKSYLGAVIHRIDPENTFGFGFHDFQVKLVRDVKARHQVQFAITAGRSRLEQDAERIDVDDVQEGVNDIGVAVVTWRFLASPRFVADAEDCRHRQQVQQRQSRRSRAAPRASQRADVPRRLDLSAHARPHVRGRGRSAAYAWIAVRPGARFCSTAVCRARRLQHLDHGRFVVRAPAGVARARDDCARCPRRSFHAHGPHIGVPVDSNPVAADACADGARRRRHLPAGAGLCRAEGTAGRRTEGIPVVSRRRGGRSPARPLDEMAVLGLRP